MGKHLNITSQEDKRISLPTGDFLVVGTDQPVVRVYDVNTSACFVGAIPKHQVGQVGQEQGRVGLAEEEGLVRFTSSLRYLVS
jgi:hypothetical protein